MGRIVKFVDTASKGNSVDGFKAPNGKYFSTRQAYEQWEQKRIDRARCIEALMDLLGYDNPDMKPNTYLFRGLKSLEPYGYDVIFDTILECEDSIEYALETKEFNSEINEIKYIMAIINNNIMPIYRQKCMQAKHTQTATVVNISDYMSDTNIGGVSGKGHDVSNLLGEDD